MVYKNQKLGTLISNAKRRFKNVNYDKNSDIYLLFNKNIHTKKILDDFETNNKNKDNKKQSITTTIKKSPAKNKDDEFNKKLDLLFKYCNLNDKVPTESTKFENILIGKFFSRTKEKIISTNDDLYNKLSTNKYLKESIDNLLEKRQIKQDNNIQIIDSDTHIENLFKFCNENNRIPTQNETSGIFFMNAKQKIKNGDLELYSDLAKNQIVKDTIDTFLSKDDLKYKEKLELLFEYCDTYKKYPPSRTIYKNVKIAAFFDRLKKKIKDNNNSKLYNELSQNEYLKLAIDNYLKK